MYDSIESTRALQKRYKGIFITDIVLLGIFLVFICNSIFNNSSSKFIETTLGSSLILIVLCIVGVPLISTKTDNVADANNYYEDLIKLNCV